MTTADLLSRCSRLRSLSTHRRMTAQFSRATHSTRSSCDSAPVSAGSMGRVADGHAARRISASASTSRERSTGRARYSTRAPPSVPRYLPTNHVWYSSSAHPPTDTLARRALLSFRVSMSLAEKPPTVSIYRVVLLVRFHKSNGGTSAARPPSVWLADSDIRICRITAARRRPEQSSEEVADSREQCPGLTLCHVAIIALMWGDFRSADFR